jgi:hypothetical protein
MLLFFLIVDIKIYLSIYMCPLKAKKESAEFLKKRDRDIE